MIDLTELFKNSTFITILIISIVVLFLIISGIFLYKKTKDNGGGIKGAAHIGVMKALEEENIKIDCISGTSSGSIVAAMYAMGYNSNEMIKLFKRYGKEITKVNWKIISKLILGLLFERKINIQKEVDDSIFEIQSTYAEN